MDINTLINDNMMEYSSYVLLHRCLPDLRDALKPIHRHILYSMWSNKSTSLTKCANVTGAVMKFSPHGSSYSTIVNMVQKDNQLVPLITGKGNFAQHTSRDMQEAAERYTECRLSDMAIDMLSRLNDKVVDFVDNYDGTKKMPVCLPTVYPAILCYTNIGIGVGMASCIASFNMNEVNDSVINYINSGNKTNLIPDLATGGFINKNDNEIQSINQKGFGSITLRAKVNIDKNVIEVLEIPYTTTREAIIDKVVTLVKTGKLKQVVSIKDLTDLKGMKIEITCRKSAKIHDILQQLYKMTPMESTMSINMRMLVDGLPKVLGVWDVIDKWLIFRRECIVRSIESEIEILTCKKHILEAFEKIIEFIDEVIDIIRNTDEKLIIKTLMNTFKIHEIQAEYIGNVKLKHLNKANITRQLNDYENTLKTIAEYEQIKNDTSKINDIIIKDLRDINKKYVTKRRTQII